MNASIEPSMQSAPRLDFFAHGPDAVHAMERWIGRSRGWSRFPITCRKLPA